MSKYISKNELEVEVKTLFKNILKINENIQIDRVLRNKFDTWDSINHLNLILSVEEKFDISLSSDDIESIDDLKSLLKIIFRIIKI